MTFRSREQERTHEDGEIRGTAGYQSGSACFSRLHPTHESPTVFVALHATIRAGLRTLGRGVVCRCLLGTASQARERAQCRGAGRSRLPLRGSSGVGSSPHRIPFSARLRRRAPLTRRTIWTSGGACQAWPLSDRRRRRSQGLLDDSFPRVAICAHFSLRLAEASSPFQLACRSGNSA
jgi:hypothetical protein